MGRVMVPARMPFAAAPSVATLPYTAGQAFLKPVMDALIQFRGSGLPAATSDPMPATTTVGVRV